LATEVPIVLRVFAERSSSVNSVLQDTKKQFDSLAGSIESVAQKTALIAGGITAALGGVLTSVFKVAGQFEQLKVKLESTLGSGEKAAKAFGDALQYAAKTPFDVQGIVKATVTLTAFGQSAQRTLPLAANLAAAFGEQINDVALVLGKAFSGSSRGFLSLTNQFGISNLVLKKYGAELTETGSISLKTSGALEKARDALEKIIKTKFGDAVEKQSKTLFGALSNLGDVVQRIAASFGQTLIPALTTGTRALTGFLEIFENLSPGTKQFIVVGGIAAVTLGALTTAAALLTSVVAGGVGRLVAFAAAIGSVGTASAAAGASGGFAALTDFLGAFAGTGTQAAAAGMARVAGAAGALGSSVLGAVGAVLSFLGPLGLLAGLVGGGLYLATTRYQNKVEAANKVIKEQAKALSDARGDLQLYTDLIEKAANAQGKLASGSGSVSDFAGRVRAALEGAVPNQFLVNLQKAGVTTDDLRKALEASSGAAKEQGAKVQQLTEVLGILQRGQTNSFDFISSEDNAKVEALRKEFGGLPPTIKLVENSLKTYRQALADNLKTSLGISGALEFQKKAITGFDEATTKAQDLQTFLQFATKPDDVNALSGAFGVLESKISEVEGILAKQGVQVGNIGALQQSLLTGSEEEKTAAAELLKLYEAREQLQTKIASKGKADIAKQIQQTEQAFEREEILGKQNFDSEVSRINQLLALKGLSEEQELSLLRKKKQVLDEQAAASLKVGQGSLKQVTGAGAESIEAVRATGQATAQETVNAIQGVLTSLDQWAAKNQKLLAQNPQLKNELTSTIRGYQKELDSAKLEIPKERLTAALEQVKAFGAEALTNTEKLAAAQRSIAFLENTINAGTITTTKEKKRLQDELNSAKKDELGLAKAVQKEQTTQARETDALRRQGQEGELELLKAQQQLEGKSAFRQGQIDDLQKRILAEKIQAIREQEQAEQESGVSAEQAAARREERIGQILKQETLKRIQEQQAQTQSVETEEKKRQAIIEQFANNRQGGPNSILQSLGEVSARSSFLGDFSLGGGFGSGFGAGKFGSGPGLPGPPQTLSQVQAQVARDVQRGDVLAGRGTPNNLAQEINANEREKNRLSGGPHFEQHISIQGEPKDDKPALKALARAALEELVKEQELRGRV